MKKKKGFLAILLCFMFLFCACSPLDGGPNGDSSVSAISGAKVLAKPAEYDISDALGGFSKNYYNIFSQAILKSLYGIYEDQNIENNILFEGLPTGQDRKSFKDFTGDDEYKKYYLFDSLRYTIEKVETFKNSSETIDYQILTIKQTPWGWNVPGQPTFFEKLNTIHNDFVLTYDEDKEQGGIVGLSNNQVLIKNDRLDSVDWTHYYAEETIPSFSEAYAADDNQSEKMENDKSIVDFYYSPYYNRKNADKVSVSAEDMQNYFQDAFEYAIYLFVLGYDMQEDADYFNFTISHNADNTAVADITVGGWEGETISISNGENCALDRVKELYQKTGKYIGITDANRGQIVNFIKDEIIGENATNVDNFEVDLYTDRASAGQLKFARNYDIVINNIVNYACEQAKIGKDTVSGEDLRLDRPYLMSTVTDYNDTYFAVSYDDNSDDDPLKYIESAEYQSIVIFPNEEEISKYYEQNGEYPTLGDIALIFEYNSNVDGKVNAEELTINVGVRFYKHGQTRVDGKYTGEFVGKAEHQIVLKHGAIPKYSDGYNVDTWPAAQASFMINFSDTGTGADEAFGEGVYVSEPFKNLDAINPFVSGTKIDDQRATLTLTGNNRAREYYMLNESSSYGSYGTLNPAMFDGADGCDYFEIFFDIEKSKSEPDVNYNFKVGISGFGFNGKVF